MLEKQSILCLTLTFFLFLQCSTQTTHPFPQAVIDEMASRKMRYHHFLWHNIRDNWLQFNESVQAEIRLLGWEPPRPSRNFTESGDIYMLADNDSGQDFLYMHRQMILRVNEIITLNNDSYGNITGWETIPGPNDTDWEVPPPYIIPNTSGNSVLISSTKTDEFYIDKMQPLEDALKNPRTLQKLTLGQLGTVIEAGIHSWMHTRWSAESPIGYRARYVDEGNGLPYIDNIWDNSSYIWLPDSYASPVNEIFYKLHGWIDDRIEDWREANNLTEINWNGTWVGGPMENIADLLLYKESSSVGCEGMDCMDMNNEEGGTMDQLVQIVLGTGKESSVFDEVIVDVEVLPLPPVKSKLKRKEKLRSCRNIVKKKLYK